MTNEQIIDSLQEINEINPSIPIAQHLVNIFALIPEDLLESYNTLIDICKENNISYNDSYKQFQLKKFDNILLKYLSVIRADNVLNSEDSLIIESIETNSTANSREENFEFRPDELDVQMISNDGEKLTEIIED